MTDGPVVVLDISVSVVVLGTTRVLHGANIHTVGVGRLCLLEIVHAVHGADSPSVNEWDDENAIECDNDLMILS